jgi:hypothetical protein
LRAFAVSFAFFAVPALINRKGRKGSRKEPQRRIETVLVSQQSTAG